MKKVLRFLIYIPVIIYSITWGMEQISVDYTSSSPSYSDFFLPALGISFIVSIAIIILHIVNCLTGKQLGKESTVYSLLLKLIPIYPCLNLIPLLMVGVIIPLIGWLGAGVIIMYFCSIMTMTGIIQIGSIICLFREKKISIIASILCGLLSFMPVADIIVATILIVYAYRGNRELAL